MRTYEYSKLGLENLALVERPLPRPAAHQVPSYMHREAHFGKIVIRIAD
jgi:hypothetical protein